MAKKGRSTVYNSITSEEKMAQVNQDNIDLEKDIPLALQYSAYQHQSEKETLKQILDRRLANITQ